jgi:hypothetical protein
MSGLLDQLFSLAAFTSFGAEQGSITCEPWVLGEKLSRSADRIGRLFQLPGIERRRWGEQICRQTGSIQAQRARMPVCGLKASYEMLHMKYPKLIDTSALGAR